MPQAKYSHEEKLIVIKGVIEQQMTYRASAAQIGACKSDAQKWVGLYKAHGPEGLIPDNKWYDGQTRLLVIEYMYKNNLSTRETATKFGILSPSTIIRWKSVYDKEGREALLKEDRGRKKVTKMPKRTPRQPKCPTTCLDKAAEKALITENKRLKMENANLKKLNALVQKRIQREGGEK